MGLRQIALQQSDSFSNRCSPIQSRRSKQTLHVPATCWLRPRSA